MLIGEMLPGALPGQLGAEGRRMRSPTREGVVNGDYSDGGETKDRYFTWRLIPFSIQMTAELNAASI
jgi:hypothetical protein